MEAQIFEPQILMLEDSDLIGGTIEYIRENHLTAERAFEWRVLEWEAQWSHTGHPMVLDKLNDLADVQARVLRRLLGIADPELEAMVGHDKVIVVARDLTPSIAAQLDPARVVGLATDAGTRTSHSSILARSLKIPAVVSLGTLSDDVRTGDEMILDGRTGKVIVLPTEEEKRKYRELDFQVREWEQELLLLAHLESTTQDGAHVALRANIDLPSEAASAQAHGAEGVGLFRTEFLVVGRSSVPAGGGAVRGVPGGAGGLPRTSRSRSAPTTSGATSSRPSSTCRRRRTPSSAGARSGSASTSPRSSGRSSAPCCGR